MAMFLQEERHNVPTVGLMRIGSRQHRVVLQFAWRVYIAMFRWQRRSSFTQHVVCRVEAVVLRVGRPPGLQIKDAWHDPSKTAWA